MRCNGALCRQRTRGLCNVFCGQSSTRQWHTQDVAAAKQLCAPLPARAVTQQRQAQHHRTAAVGAACCPRPHTSPLGTSPQGSSKAWGRTLYPLDSQSEPPPRAAPTLCTLVSTSVPGGAGRGLRAQHMQVSPLLPRAWLLQLPLGALVQDVICTCLQLRLQRLCNCCILRKKIVFKRQQ